MQRMNMRWMWLPLVLLVFGYCASVSGEEHGCASMKTAIRQANPDEYKAITGARNWKNPFLLVSVDGVTIIDSKQHRKFVRVEAVPDELSKMSISEWPYGLVVALQENGVVAGNGHSERITDNVIKLRKLLTQCGIRAEGWPSA